MQRSGASYNSYDLNRMKSDYEYQLKSISDKLKEKEQEYWKKETQIRN